MHEIHNKQAIQHYIQKYKITQYFLNLPEFELFHFKKEELINTRLNPNDYILFLVKGTILLSNIREDGSMYQISHIHPFTCLGDMEFPQKSQKQFLIQAQTDCEFLTISLSKYRHLLQKDYRFLFYLLGSIAAKMNQTSSVIAEHRSLEERLIHHIQTHNNTLQNIEKTANELCCSRRQLQRLLKKLCDNQTLIKLKKGTYQLR